MLKARIIPTDYKAYYESLPSVEEKSTPKNDVLPVVPTSSDKENENSFEITTIRGRRGRGRGNVK